MTTEERVAALEARVAMLEARMGFHNPYPMPKDGLGPAWPGDCACPLTLTTCYHTVCPRRPQMTGAQHDHPER